jgi:hypothetical protein
MKKGDVKRRSRLERVSTNDRARHNRDKVSGRFVVGGAHILTCFGVSSKRILEMYGREAHSFLPSRRDLVVEEPRRVKMREKVSHIIKAPTMRACLPSPLSVITATSASAVLVQLVAARHERALSRLTMASLVSPYGDLGLDDATLRAVVEHISFPPRLPQEAPEQQREVAVESAICALTAAAARFYGSECSPEEGQTWARLANTLEQLGLSSAVPLSQTMLLDGITKMAEKGAFPVEPDPAARY